MKFIDTHCHIIPAVDDGPAETDESVRMARLAAEDGITAIVATPHIVEGVYDGSDLRERVAGLESVLTQAGIGLTLKTGAEVPLSLCAAVNADTLKKFTIGGGDFLLVETSDIDPRQLEDIIYKIRMCGLYPVLAHPERTLMLEKKIDYMSLYLAGNDVFVQVTAASIEGLFGRKIQKKCMNMIKAGMVHLVATDAHSYVSRAPVMSKSYRILSDTIGSGAAVLMAENPGRVLENMKPLAIGSAHRRSGKSFLARMTGGKTGV